MALFPYQIRYNHQMNLKLGETLLSLQHSKPTEIPEFAEEQLQAAKEQIKRLNEQIKRLNEGMKSESNESTAEEQAFKKAKFALLLDQLYRIKRFMLIYFNFRCERIEDQFWMFGGDLNNSQKSHLSEQEKAYFPSYKQLVMDYVEEVGVELTIELEPPLESEVEVRILQDCGEVLNESGQMIKLEKNSSFFIRKRLIEPFVRQGTAIIKTKR